MGDEVRPCPHDEERSDRLDEVLKQSGDPRRRYRAGALRRRFSLYVMVAVALPTTHALWRRLGAQQSS
jgi:hypothetical protein